MPETTGVATNSMYNSGKMDEMAEILSRETWSRRNFLRSTAALTLSHSVLGSAQNSFGVLNNGKLFAYAGTYTSAVDGGANGEGIYLFEMDPHTGELSGGKLVAKTPNPSWIVIHPSKKYLYTINEVTNYQGGGGSVSAFSIDAETGGLTFLNTVSSEGAGPAHMSLDAEGRYAFIANYAGGSIAVLPIMAGGLMGAAVDVHSDTGALGSKHATDAPRGSFAISGHDHPHAHMIAPAPDNRFVLATDLAQDRIYVYKFDATTGKLTPAESTPFVSLPSGNGPRHFAFHPNGHWLYLLEEEASAITFFRYDPATGALTSQQTIASLPAGFAGTSFTSEIGVSPDGKFLYCANRLHDTISICSISADGKLTRIGEASTMGDYPRHFQMDPSGNFLYVCNQRSDCITSFRRNRETGLLTFTGKYTPVGSPAILTFLV
ncbi:MAG: lactonase family protein [Terracidiphilus sp.]|nr:lactonase family protein [Terracidiphilus sp.]